MTKGIAYSHQNSKHNADRVTAHTIAGGEQEDFPESSPSFIVVPHRQTGSAMLSPSCIGPFTCEVSEDSNHENTSSEHESDVDAVEENSTLSVRIRFDADVIDAVAETGPTNITGGSIAIDGKEAEAQSCPSTLEEAFQIIKEKDQEILDLNNQLAIERESRQNEIKRKVLAAKNNAAMEQVMRDQLKKIAAGATDDSFLKEITLTLERR